MWKFVFTATAVAVIAFLFRPNNRMTVEQDESPYETFHQHTTLVHSVLRRGMQQLIKHAPAAASDTSNFMGYASALLDNLDQHHQQEDDVLFPVLATRFPEEIKHLAEQHVQVEDILSRMRSYCLHVQSNAETYDAEKFASLAAELKSILLPHLEQEERAFPASVLQKAFPSYETELKPVGQQIARRAQKDGSPFTSLSFLLRHMTDDEKMHLFAKVPFVVRDYIFPIFPYVHSGYWAYATASDEM